ncbi:hypothetical protein E5Q_04836 [Mixia osmundae IAM 14324]|uniref:Uncharacterized protein n=1 Tax=Mixia osmundae (strain CBS 9802 / IAM 14324 / JCM 22182 / KY 12970) TaxID=764103 RepID=G7E5P4_MIXOS|nr:hypothetical protein E5Q_04836 [Mixia osmundae IAM 14324]
MSHPQPKRRVSLKQRGLGTWPDDKLRQIDQAAWATAAAYALVEQIWETKAFCESGDEESSSSSDAASSSSGQKSKATSRGRPRQTETQIQPSPSDPERRSATPARQITPLRRRIVLDSPSTSDDDDAPGTNGHTRKSTPAVHGYTPPPLSAAQTPALSETSLPDVQADGPAEATRADYVEMITASAELYNLPVAKAASLWWACGGNATTMKSIQGAIDANLPAVAPTSWDAFLRMLCWTSADDLAALEAVGLVTSLEETQDTQLVNELRNRKSDGGIDERAHFLQKYDWLLSSNAQAGYPFVL